MNGPAKLNLRTLFANFATSLLPQLQTDEADLADIYFCYRLLLRRGADEAGWEHWAKKVALGLPRDELTKAFLFSREFHQKQTLKEQQKVTLDDFVIYVNPHDSAVVRSVTREQGYEPHVTAIIRKILKSSHVFLDIGSNIGWFTLLAASVVRDGKVISFEPNHNNLQLLYRSVVENKFDNVVIFPYAATAQRSLLQLSGHAAYGFVHALESTDDEYVQGAALDELLREEPRIDVIKMDIEGHEPIALQGMRETIGKHKPFIISEFHPVGLREIGKHEPRDYLDMLIGMGYRLSVIEHSGNELEFGGPDAIIDSWQALNQKYDTGDTMHLDILARPT